MSGSSKFGLSVSVAWLVVACGSAERKEATEGNGGFGGEGEVSGTDGSSGATTAGGDAAVAGTGPAGGRASTGGSNGVGGTSAVGGTNGSSAEDGGVAGAAAGASSDGEVEPGTCGIVRRISLPVVSAFDTARVTRQVSGFVVGPWVERGEEAGTSIHWLSVGGAGEQRAQRAEERLLFPYATFATGAGTRILQVNRRPPSPAENGALGQDIWESIALADGATTLAPARTILRARWRGTNVMAGAASLDGERGLFVVWPIAMEAPRAALLDAEGALVGAPITLDPTDQTFFDCTAVISTEHGVAASFRDADTQSFHLVDFDASGSATQRTVELPSPSCPTITLTDDGFAFTQRVDDAQNRNWSVVRLARDGARTEELLELPPVHGLSYLTFSGDTLLAVSGSTSEAPAILRRRNGVTERFPIEVERRSWSAIPAEPGSLYLDLVETNPDTSAQRHEIVELGCR